MFKKNKTTHTNLFIIFAFTLFISVSCSTARRVSTYEIKPMSTSKIIRRVTKEIPSYKNYESKRISLNYEDNNNRNNFSGQFKIDRDKCIILTLKKLNMPLGRGYITPDSFIFVNYYDKNYIQDNIQSLQQILGIDLDFDLLQALLTADISKLITNEEFDKELTSYIDENMYRIDSQFKSKISKAITAGNNKRLNRYMKRMNDSEFINYNVWIDPQYFVIRKLTVKDIKYNENLTIHYDQYELVDHSLFPQQITVEFATPQKNTTVELKLSKTSVNKQNDFSFNIPDKFEKQNLPKN